MLAALVVLFVCAISAPTGWDVAFSGNTNISTSNGQFHYRMTTLTKALGSPSLSFASVAVDAQQGSAQGDVLAGGFFTGGLFGLPYVYLTVSHTEVVKNTVSSQAALIGYSYTKIEEVTPNGTVAQTLLMTEVDFTVGNVVDVDGGQLQYALVTGSTLKLGFSNFNITLTPIAAKVAGVLASGAAITPTSVEIYVQLCNWPYKDTANSIRLVAGVVTATLSLTANIKTVADTHNLNLGGSGSSQVFLAFAGTAQTDGNKTTVQVDIKTDASLPDDWISSYITSLQTIAGVSLKTDRRVVTTTFKSGANCISWDPTVGTGANPNTDNAAGFLAPGIVTMALFCLVSIFLF